MTTVPMPIKVLVVDDDDVDREKVRRLLVRSDHDFALTEAEDAASALELINNQTFDCMLLDWNIGGTTGPELLDQLGQRRPPAVMLSGYDAKDFAALASRHGAQGILGKQGLGTENLQAAIIGAIAAAHI